MIIALAWWLLSLFGGGAASPFGQKVDQVAERVEVAVHERTRRKAALTVLDQMRQREQALEKILAKQTELFAKQVNSYGHASDALRASIEQARADMKAARDELLSMRFALTGHLTAAEWHQVFPTE